MLNDMRQVEIDTMYIRVFWCDQVNVNPKTTSNINKPFYALETIVALKNLVHNYFGMIDHRCIENLVEPWVQAWIIKGMCAMNHVEWDTPFSNCIIKLRPKNGKIETRNYVFNYFPNKWRNWLLRLKKSQLEGLSSKKNSCCNIGATIL